ncbi:uncharacterized protein LOC106076196 [Biomphalaria glabrata]|uniref:Uncharacterized protein LOC106076196 n=1 Tax=Biomphalaria glabrata TaxID=6526 RepID=A0A9W3AXP5_BIOGL|nr:uncharacterized protein LOC106076196 [Biomphalaria glabrata]
MDMNSIFSSKYFLEGQTASFDLESPNTRSQPFGTSRLHLDLYKGDKAEYDEVDLISECSYPGAYVPGKFLQICDMTPDASKDTLIWPVSLSGTVRSELEPKQIITGQSSQVSEDVYSQRQVSRRHQRFSLQNPKYFVPLVVCIIVALFALGGLAAVI